MDMWGMRFELFCASVASLSGHAILIEIKCIWFLYGLER